MSPFPRVWCIAELLLAYLPAFVLAQFEDQMRDVLDVEKTVMQWYFEVTGMRARCDQPADSWDGCPRNNIGNWSTDGGISRLDIELYLRLSKVFSPQRIFIIGNAWRYSAFVLSCIFGGASVDAIDAGIFGSDNVAGIKLTRSVAKWANRDVSVFHGFSPADTHRALRFKGQPYELIFIDGKHTATQLFQDFEGIHPYLAEHSVVVLHDIMPFKMQRGVYTILCAFPEMRFAYYMSNAYSRLQLDLGIGFMYRGFSDAAFTGFHALEIPYQCGELPVHKQPVVYMAPKLLPKPGERTDMPEPLCLSGIINEMGRSIVCCAPECIRCGGPFCDEQWPGSGEKCCGGSIKKICKSEAGPPPCIYRYGVSYGIYM